MGVQQLDPASEIWMKPFGVTDGNGNFLN